MRYWLVMPAAGAGRRFGAALPKQYAALAGRTVIEWALDPFLRDPRCLACAVAIAADDTHWSTVAARLGSAVRIAQGGAERGDSVRNALQMLARDAVAEDWVLVHDAARPCLDERDRDRLLRELENHPTGGLLAAPCTDTMKRADESQCVAVTVPRDAMWRALTPQMFRFGALRAALESARAEGRHPTDEAQALEWCGERPRLVAGDASNLKVTTADDLALAETVLGRRGTVRRATV